jgi:hypothetical protein
MAQGEPSWVSSCTLIPLPPSLAGRTAGVEFLLLHLALLMTGVRRTNFGAGCSDGIQPADGSAKLACQVACAAYARAVESNMHGTQEQYKARILSYAQGHAPLALLAANPDALAALLLRTTASVMQRRPSPDKWSIQEITAHLADDELVGAYRIRLILSKPDTEIQAFDQDAWALNGRYSLIGPQESLALYRMLRMSNLALWNTLTPDEWERAGVHAERGRESIKDIVNYYAGHDLNHFAQIQAILGSGEKL